MVTIDQEKCIGCGMCAADAVSIPDYEMSDVEEYDKETFCLEPEKVLHSISRR